MIWGVDHSTLQTKSSSFFIIRGNPVLTTGSSSLRPVLWKWHEQKFMCRNNISKLTLFKKVWLITPKLQVRLITPPDATSPWKPKNWKKKSKKFEIRILTCDEKLKSSYFRQYQSYISNWYINGKVFTSTTTLKPKNLKKKKFKKARNSNFDLWRRAEITLPSSISALH